MCDSEEHPVARAARLVREAAAELEGVHDDLPPIVHPDAERAVAQLRRIASGLEPLPRLLRLYAEAAGGHPPEVQSPGIQA